MPETETDGARTRVVTVSLTEAHVNTLDTLARTDNRSRSAELRTLIEDEAARRPDLATPTAPQAA